MIKKIFLGIAAALVVGLLVEGLRLLRLRRNVKVFADHWKDRTRDGEFLYVALGDSAAQGIGASKPENGYVGLLARDIERATGKSVKVVNIGVSGAKIQDVIDTQLPHLASYKPDLVTVEVGSNNIRTFNAADFKIQYDELARRLPAGAYVANIPYFGGVYRNNRDAISASKIIADAAQTNGLVLVDLQGETSHRQSIRNYAADYFHPNNRAYKIWRDSFWRQMALKL